MQMTAELLEMDLLDDSLTLCWVSIYLSIAMPDASIDYECVDDVHRFSVVYRESIYEVDFAEDVLTSMEGDELVYMLEQVVDRVREDAAPGPIILHCYPPEELQAA